MRDYVRVGLTTTSHQDEKLGQQGKFVTIINNSETSSFEDSLFIRGGARGVSPLVGSISPHVGNFLAPPLA